MAGVITNTTMVDPPILGNLAVFYFLFSVYTCSCRSVAFECCGLKDCRVDEARWRVLKNAHQPRVVLAAPGVIEPGGKPKNLYGRIVKKIIFAL